MAALPGSAEHLIPKLVGYGHACIHFPKIRPGEKSGIPHRLGFLTRNDEVCILQTKDLCDACYADCVPCGFTFYMEEHSQDLITMTGQVECTGLLQPGTQRWVPNSTLLTAFNDNPLDCYPHFLAPRKGKLPLQSAAEFLTTRNPLPQAVREWFHSQMKPFYIETLHFPSTFIEANRAVEDARIARKRGYAYDSNVTLETALKNTIQITGESVEAPSKAVTRQSIPETIPGNLDTQNLPSSAAQPASGKRPSKQRVDSAAVALVAEAISIPKSYKARAVPDLKGFKSQSIRVVHQELPSPVISGNPTSNSKNGLVLIGNHSIPNTQPHSTINGVELNAVLQLPRPSQKKHAAHGVGSSTSSTAQEFLISDTTSSTDSRSENSISVQARTKERKPSKSSGRLSTNSDAELLTLPDAAKPPAHSRLSSFRLNSFEDSGSRSKLT